MRVEGRGSRVEVFGFEGRGLTEKAVGTQSSLDPRPSPLDPKRRSRA